MLESSAILTTVILSVLLFGTVEDWSIALVGVLSLVFFNLWLVNSIKKGQGLPSIQRSLLLCIAAFLGFSLFQIVPLPPFLLKVLSPVKYSALETVSRPGFQSISVYPYATLHALLKLIVYLTLFLMAVSLAERKEGLRMVVRGLVFFGFILSVFALLQKAAWNGRIYWFREVPTNSNPFGPFVNRNHFAGFINMLIPFGIAMSIQARENAKRFLYIFLSVVMGVALFFSLSRGGIISFLVSFTFFSVTIIHRRMRSLPILISGTFALLLLSYLLYLGLEPVIERFSQTDISLGRRTDIWISLLAAVRDHWLAGTGLGTFSYVSPLYHPVDAGGFYDHAHNDYLEFLMDVGVTGVAIAAAFALIVLREVMRSGWWRSRRFYLTLAGLSSLVSIAVHSISDFNLHITSNAITLSVIIGFLYGNARRRSHMEGSGSTGLTTGRRA